jgi:carboxyl-terminal processing protease
MRRRLIIIVVLMLSLLATINKNAIGEDNNLDQDFENSVKKFSYILSKIIMEHPDTIKTEEFTEELFNMMFKELDPYSSYINKEKYMRLMDRSKGSSYELPFKFFFVNDTMRVMERSRDIEIGIDDKIIELNGIKASKENIKQINEVLSNDDINDIIIKYMEKNFEIKRIKTDKVIKEVSSIPYAEKLNNGLLYAKIDMFSASTLSEFREINDNNDYSSLIIDLRENKGGYIYSAADMSSIFLEEGLLITKLKSKSGDYDSTYYSRDVGIRIDCPVVLLVSDETASAAEIFAGCLQDHDRAFIVGEITEGKGFINKVWSFADSTALSLVVGSYYTPLGRSIQKPYKQENIEDIKEDLMMQGAEEDEIAEMIMKTGGRTKLPTFMTKKGRVLLGGGGIVPDKMMQLDTNSMYVRALESRQAFLEFAFLYYDEKGNELKKYESYKEYQSKYVVSNEVIFAFSRYLMKRNMLNKELFKDDIEAIKLYIKSFIAYIYWGTDGFHHVRLSNDEDVKRALEYLENAEKLIKE